MAIADNILHLERSRTTIMVNGTERTLTPSAVGNGNLSLGPHITPKFKKRKVSAVRVFPPGCGRFAAKTVESSLDQWRDAGIANECQSAGATDSVEANTVKPEVVRDFPPGCGFNEGKTVESTKEANKVKPEVERDFPPGCGFNEGKTVESIKVQGVDSEFDTVEVPRHLDSTAELVPTNDMEIEEETPKVASPEAIHVDNLELSKGNPELNCCNENQGATHTRVVIIGSENGSARNVKYPPRRRVSAVRDFPPFCGRNAPSLRKEECLNEVSSPKNDNRGDSSEFEDGKALDLKETEEGLDEKQREGSLLNWNSENCGGEGTMSESKSEEVEIAEGRPNKAESKLDDTQEIKGYQVASRTEETNESDSDSDVVLLEKPLPDEIMSSKGEGSSKMKHPGDFPKRIKVLGLMASPNCPWQRERRALRSPPSTGSAGKRRVKHHNFSTAKSKAASKKSIYKEQESGSKTSKESWSVSEDSLQLDEQSKSAPSNLKKESRLSECNTSNRTLEDVPEDATDDGGKQLVIFTLDNPVPLRQHSGKIKSGSRKKTKANKTQSKTSKRIRTVPGEGTDDGAGQIVPWEEEEVLEVEEQVKDLQSRKRPRKLSLDPPPFGHVSTGESSTATRNKVRETLRLYQAVYRKLLQEEEAKPNKEGRPKRIDLLAEGILKEKGRFLNTKKVVGELPGVEVGDEFQYRAELRIVGLHSPIMGGIDYVKQGNKIIATSIVSSGAYKDDLESSDYLIYTGSGGNVVEKKKEPEDQKLERGNLALSNSVDEQNPVRVIRGLKETRPSSSSNAKSKVAILYTYDGLYVVDKYWQEAGEHGKLVFKFLLKRKPNQPELAWKVVSKSKKHEAREGLCVKDISLGKESFPIPAVNTINDEKPPTFKYITRVMYPNWCNPIPPEGCECTNGCSDSDKCPCAVKNGGEIPYNFNGSIVEVKPLVYECGPLCKCPPSCHNRVSQHGIKFPLEIFKTESRGWGVRSLASIPSGSFICEYIGELLEDKEAEARAGNDEYLFDIGNNYSDTNLWDGLSTLIPDSNLSLNDTVDEMGFTIDAAQYGNIGRFINHSCSPNLYAQNVLYDHVDKRIPHIMLFAAENIPPLQELTYHYNYMIDQVRDSDGNIKQKPCFCGSSECTGRMY